MEKNFYKCSLCGKKLIQRKGNGLWVFKFGKSQEGFESPIEMEIFGDIRMRCIRKSCRNTNPDHWNVFTYLPKLEEKEEKGGKRVCQEQDL